MINTTVPAFLKQPIKANHKQDLEMAFAMYCNAANSKADSPLAKSVRIQWLHPLLCRRDKAWDSIPIDQMKTTPPRELIQRMNTHLYRIKAMPERIQKLMDELKASATQEDDYSETIGNDQTDSEPDQEETSELRGNMSMPPPPGKNPKSGFDHIFQRPDGGLELSSTLYGSTPKPPSPISGKDVAKITPDSDVESVTPTPASPDFDEQQTPQPQQETTTPDVPKEKQADQTKIFQTEEEAKDGCNSARLQVDALA